MATYKVIQDIEAEDKLLGPLTLRQFIYAGICVLMLYLTYLGASKGAPFVALLFLPIAGATGFFAWPWGRDQPTEVWALAKIRFLFKPRKRIWDQNGAKELVTITVPKKIEATRTNGLSQTEVRSRLEALANTIDSRGWAIKNVNANLFAQPTAMTIEPDSDRLISLNNIPQVNEVADFDVRADDDILDEQNNAQAQRVDSMIAASTRAHREQMLQEMRTPAAQPMPAPLPQAAAQQSATAQPPADYWFLQPPAPTPQPGTTMFTPQIVAAQTPVAPTAMPAAGTQTSAANDQMDEATLMQTLRAQDQRNLQANAYGHLHTLQPLSARGRTAPMPQPQAAQPTTPQVTPANKAAMLDLARNDDLNVATIAREAQKRAESQDEVVISLH